MLHDTVPHDTVPGLASMWGEIIVVCELGKGARILWHSDYDRKVIAYLKREFGSSVVKPDFWKTLPRNKQFKKYEIVAVWNYLIDSCYQGKDRFRKGLLHWMQENYARIYEQLKRHQFDGVGFKEDDWPEIMIFNPSKVRLVSVHWWNAQMKDISAPLSQNELKTIQEVAVVEWRKDQEEWMENQ